MFLKNLKLIVCTFKRFKTIYALSSGTLPSAIAVLRISGKESENALKILTKKENFKARQIFYTEILDENNEILDKSMACFFRGPSTFTGEDSVELYLHGSRAVLNGVFKRLAKIPGLESAKAGEFTKRAFFNGKFDLAQVEALSDLINSETDSQRRLALRQDQIGNYLKPLRDQLINLIAHFEAGIDFAEDVEDMQLDKLKRETKILYEKLLKLRRSADRGCLIRSGVHIALVGRTNVGKSSLINRLAEKEIAIVSDISGTTRDSIDLRIQLNSVLVNITDTAGIRETGDQLEMEGIRRSILRASEAHILVLILDLTQNSENLKNEIENLLKRFNFQRELQKLIICFNKSDLFSMEKRQNIIRELESFSSSSSKYTPIIWSNCVEDDGLKDLIKVFEREVQNLSGVDENANELLLSRNRHVELLEKALKCLEEVQEEIDADSLDAAILAHHLRVCADAIGEIAGRIVNEQILDKIFSQFCIGK